MPTDTLLAELSLRGCVSDADGKVKPSGSKRTGDRVLDDVLREMSDDRPRSWGAWVGRRSRTTRDRKEHAARITACTELAGPAAPALRKVMRGVKAARAGAYASG